MGRNTLYLSLLSTQEALNPLGETLQSKTELHRFLLPELGYVLSHSLFLFLFG